MTELKTTQSIPTTLHLRSEVQPSDVQDVRRIVEASQFFSAAEVDVAVELVQERLQKGAASGYEFLFAEHPVLVQDRLRQQVIGYVCYGEIPCTVGSYDIYWIAISPDHQRNRIGQQLMQSVELAAKKLNARRLYIDTSGKPLYTPTRNFYVRCGYNIACELADFYAPGDSKIIFEKAIPPH